MKFQPGDVVCLKAPRMTVESISSGEDVQCVWFEGGEKRQGSFHISSLEMIKPDDGVEFIEDGSELTSEAEFIENGSKPTSDPKFTREKGVSLSSLTMSLVTNSAELSKDAKHLMETLFANHIEQDAHRRASLAAGVAAARGMFGLPKA